MGQHHIDFLTSQATLELWAGRSIKERVILFHRKFADKVISPTGLLRLYRRCGIRRKKVHVKERYPPNHVHNFQEQRTAVIKDLRYAKQNDLEIVYCDEISFNRGSLPSRDYSSKYRNIELDNI